MEKSYLPSSDLLMVMGRRLEIRRSRASVVDRSSVGGILQVRNGPGVARRWRGKRCLTVCNGASREPVSSIPAMRLPIGGVIEKAQPNDSPVQSSRMLTELARSTSSTLLECQTRMKISQEHHQTITRASPEHQQDVTTSGECVDLVFCNSTESDGG